MKIKFIPQNVEIEATPEKSVLQLATENKLEIRSICKGVPSCAECRVRVVEGAENILPPSKAELNLIGTSHYLDGRRLSCQIRCFGDVTIDLAEQVSKSENQTKKIRGFRTSKHAESTAVNDTMLLNEKVDDKALESSGDEKFASAENEGSPAAPKKGPSSQQQSQSPRHQQGASKGQKQGKGGSNKNNQGSGKQGKGGSPQKNSAPQNQRQGNQGSGSGQRQNNQNSNQKQKGPQ